MISTPVRPRYLSTSLGADELDLDLGRAARVVRAPRPSGPSAPCGRPPRSARAPGAGAMLRALRRPSPFFTATVVSPSPSSSVASRQAASSPVTSRTGQSQLPQSAALMPGLADEDAVEAQAAPLAGRRPCGARTPSGVPAIACMPTSRAASQPSSRNSVYSRPARLDDVLAGRVEQVGDERVEAPRLACAVAVHDDDLVGAGRLRAAHGGVDLLRVELAALLVRSRRRRVVCSHGRCRRRLPCH